MEQILLCIAYPRGCPVQYPCGISNLVFMTAVKKHAVQELAQENTRLHFVDVGCSGSLDEKWSPLFPWFSYTGFDPNLAECERLQALPHPYQDARYLPYAIAGTVGEQTLYQTQSIYCYSLLPPNSPWLNRFSFRDLFTVTGTESVNCTTLDHLAQTAQLQADILKLDTQGLELPILKAGQQVLDQALCVETETGLIENYQGETTYSQMDEYMRQAGFLLFDLKLNTVSRKDYHLEAGKFQPLWCEAIWLFDFIGHSRPLSPTIALKMLMICFSLRYFDYAQELAQYFYEQNCLEKTYLDFCLNPPDSLINPPKEPFSWVGKYLKKLPQNIKNRLLFELQYLNH